MKKLTSLQQKRIKGGGPCGKQLCGDVIVDGATYTGPCSSTPSWCSAAYVTSIICSGGAVTHTYCTTGLIPP